MSRGADVGVWADVARFDGGVAQGGAVGVGVERRSAWCRRATLRLVFWPHHSTPAYSEALLRPYHYYPQPSEGEAEDRAKQVAPGGVAARDGQAWLVEPGSPEQHP